MKLIKQFAHHHIDGGIAATLSLERIHSDIYFLDRRATNDDWKDVAPEVWSSLMEKALKLGREVGMKELGLRTVEGRDVDSYKSVLFGFGFRPKHERVEFRSPLERLPGDEGSPIRWTTFDPTNPKALSEAAQVMQSAAVGDPDFDPSEDAEACLKSYLSDPVLTTGPQCLQIGWLEDRAAAIVVAQIDPESGWSRITYMAMMPEFRGRGLGKWVHRHGFKMMREQGGTLYQGGTLVTNERMIRLFTRHGCDEYRRMVEWSLKTTG